MRTVTLQFGEIAKYDNDAPFFVEEGALKLRFVFPHPNGEYFLVSGKKRMLIPQNGIVVLPVEVGTLNICVKRYIKAQHRETYAVEPLEVKSVDGEVVAYPELGILQKKVVELIKQLNEAQEEMKAIRRELAEQKKAERARAVSMLAFAYAEYNYDVQLNAHGMTLDEFAARLGYTLTDEETEKIKSIKEAF